MLEGMWLPSPPFHLEQPLASSIHHMQNSSVRFWDSFHVERCDHLSWWKMVCHLHKTLQKYTDNLEEETPIQDTSFHESFGESMWCSVGCEEEVKINFQKPSTSQKGPGQATWYPLQQAGRVLILSIKLCFQIEVFQIGRHNILSGAAVYMELILLEDAQELGQESAISWNIVFMRSQVVCCSMRYKWTLKNYTQYGGLSTSVRTATWHLLD